MRTSSIISLVLTTTLAVAIIAFPAIAAQKPPAGTYTGKTENGGKFKFKLAGKKVTAINGTVPSICLETTGSYQTRAGAELFQPPGSFTLGKTKKSKALQPAAMNSGTQETKNYTVTMKPAGSRVRGKLKLSYSFLTIGPDIYHSYIWICSSSVDFTARKS